MQGKYCLFKSLFSHTAQQSTMNLIVSRKQLEMSMSSTVPEPFEPRPEQAETSQTPSSPLLGVPWARKDNLLIFSSAKTGILQNSS